MPGAFGWDDIGDFSSLAALLPDPGRGPRVLGERDLVHALDATGLVVPGSQRTVTVLGLEDVIVVDTPDALLVTTRERAQDVRALVEHLRDHGRIDLI